MYGYYGTNDWWDYLRARPTNDILAHSAKGKKWDNHKYIGITPGGSYIYPKSVMKGWSSYVEPVGPKAPKYAKPGYSGQGPARQAPKGRAPMSSMHAKAAQAKSLSDTNRKVNSFGYKANKFAQDTLNAGRGALNNAWNGLSGAVDTAGRAVSDAYDRARGNQAGSTWNRVTRGDNHLNTEDITDRVGNAAQAAGRAIGGAWDRATGGDGFDLGDVRRWARDAGNAVWNGASRAVDTVGRAASDAYDRARGGEAGSTWGRITRGDNHFDTEDLTDRAAAAGRAVGNAARGAWDRATGGDGLDIGDVRRWGNAAGRAIGDAGRRAWDATSDVVDTAGRAASNLYDRARGNEEGRTWNRITRGDDHLNTEDITDRVAAAGRAVGNAVNQARGQARQMFDAAGNRIQTTLQNERYATNQDAQDAMANYQDWMARYEASGDPRHRELAETYLADYNEIMNQPYTTPEVAGYAGNILSRAGQNAVNSAVGGAQQLGRDIGGAVNSGVNAAQQFGNDVGNTVRYTLDPAQQARVNDATRQAEYWERLAAETNNPELANLARRYRDQADRFRNYR